MNKYFAFRKLMDFMSDYAEVTDADMNFLDRYMKIVGEDDSQIIEITIEITKKEENQDA